MASTKNEFIIGCLLGGVLGATTTMLVHKKMLNGVPVSLKRKRHHKTHASDTTHSHEQKAHKPSRRKAKK